MSIFIKKLSYPTSADAYTQKVAENRLAPLSSRTD